jgi:acyl-CoA oxidase
MTVIPLSESTAPNAKAALARLQQLKGQLNLNSSPMSRQAPKDMAAERAAADFNVEALQEFWNGGEKRNKLVVNSSKKKKEKREREPLLNVFGIIEKSL